MGRPATGATTTTIRLPKRFKEKVLDYINYLKEVESSDQDRISQVSQALDAVQQAGLIDLHSIAHSYGISVTDAMGQCLPKDNLRARLIEFLSGKIRYR